MQVYNSKNIRGNFSHGNSHSHLRSLLLPSIPIPKLEFYSHSRGIPMRFPSPLGIPLPWLPLVLIDAGSMAAWHAVKNGTGIGYTYLTFELIAA